MFSEGTNLSQNSSALPTSGLVRCKLRVTRPQWTQTNALSSCGSTGDQLRRAIYEMSYRTAAFSVTVNPRSIQGNYRSPVEPLDASGVKVPCHKDERLGEFAAEFTLSLNVPVRDLR
jgi:hypothetical protein